MMVSNLRRDCSLLLSSLRVRSMTLEIKISMSLAPISSVYRILYTKEGSLKH